MRIKYDSGGENMSEQKSSGGVRCCGGGFLSFANIGLNIYRGYAHAQGMYVDPNLERASMWAPTALGGLEGAIGGGLVGSIIGAASQTDYGRNIPGGCALGGCAGSVAGASIGAGYRLAETWAAYFAGVIVGKIL